MALERFQQGGKKMQVVIVGGSISGLLHAIMLRSLGHNVRILEKEDSSRSDYGAGLAVGVHGKRFLDGFDRSGEPLTYDCPGVKSLGLNNEAVEFTPLPMYLTSWTALYYRLRGLFDGLSSPFCVHPPLVDPSHGDATFETHKKVIAVFPGPEDLLSITYEDVSGTQAIHANLVIDGSGPYSLIRSSLTETEPASQYAGFIAWRGTVPDGLVSEATNQLFDNHFLLFPMSRGNYFIGYKIPGKQGSLEPGQRLLNWIWYTTMSDPDKLRTILTDCDGYEHPNSVPRGKLNMSEWVRRRDAISSDVNLAFRELMYATKEPFVSKIQESSTQQRAFLDGRLLLVGDCANWMRPNGGMATNHAAAQCLALRDVLQGETTLQEWETLTAKQGLEMKQFSESIADRYLFGKI